METKDIESSPAPEGDELLDRAIAEWRDAATPSGPSEALLERTRSAMRRAASLQPPSRGILRLRPALLSMAAAVAVLCASIAVYRFSVRNASKVADQGHQEPTMLPGRSPTPHNDHPHVVTPAPPSPAIVGVPKTTNEPPTIVLAGGVIRGRVIFDGVAPAPAPLPGVNLMPGCEKLHGGPIYDESLLVSRDHGLANVVVSVSSGLSSWLREEFPPPPGPVVLDQKGCVFEPHVVAIMVGEPLLIKNSDPVLHNVHLLAVNNPEANLGQPTMSELATEPFASPEVFRVKCDVHPWMSAWVRVVDNPFFAVTTRDGYFTIRGLPPGTYWLKAWHEQLGVREMQVTVDADHGASADFTFKPNR